MDLNRATCEETMGMIGDKYIHCGKPATVIVWHGRDSKAYPMCPMCGDHNLRNRGGIELVPKAESEDVKS